MDTKYLVELWKINCIHCEAVKPTVAALEKEGYIFEKYNIEEQEGFILMNDYSKEIDEHNKKMGYEEGFVYTPTFINPQTREIVSFDDREPTKEDLIDLAKRGKTMDNQKKCQMCGIQFNSAEEVHKHVQEAH
ncbi:MAG TPA: hypothetical protein VFQ63_00255 [Patescibacteria group bacterium]|nr:hypothetical protein [Patescibacteria group bacterium]